MGQSFVVEAVPPEIVATMAGRKFALVGFPAREANRLARSLQETMSLSHAVGPFEAWPGSEAVKACDLVILNLSGDLHGSQWVDGNSIARNPKLLLLVGFQPEIHDHPALDSAAHDVLIRPFEPEEMVLRCSRLLSRSAGRRWAPGARREIPKVMLADDDTSMTNLLTALLQNHHMECSVAVDGEAALHTARRLMPDLVVLDVDMPRMNGFEVLAELRNEPGTHALRVMLLTADQDSADIAKGSDLGADDYVIKPFSPGVLVSRVKKLLKPSAPPVLERSLKVFIR
jgi:DNA-binding response OmpR family regulator